MFKYVINWKTSGMYITASLLDKAKKKVNVMAG